MCIRDRMDTVFYHNFPKGNNEIVLCNVLGRSNVVILFAIDKHTHLLLTEHFPTARYFLSLIHIFACGC